MSCNNPLQVRARRTLSLAGRLTPVAGEDVTRCQTELRACLRGCSAPLLATIDALRTRCPVRQCKETLHEHHVCGTALQACQSHCSVGLCRGTWRLSVCGAPAAGPPENVRDHVMAASKSLGSGDWAGSYAHLAALPVWALVPGREQVRAESFLPLSSENVLTLARFQFCLTFVIMKYAQTDRCKCHTRTPHVSSLIRDSSVVASAQLT